MKKMDMSSSGYKAGLLGVLCAICGLLLALTNSLTAPVIAEHALDTVKKNLEEIYPGASFKDVSADYLSKDESGLVDAVYEAEGKGYVFSLHGTGYNSDGFTYLLGIDSDGSFSGFVALEQKETEGIGSRVFGDQGKDAILKLSVSDEIPLPLVSGATLTSTGVKAGLEAAQKLFTVING